MLKIAILGYGGRGKNYSNIIRHSLSNKAKVEYVIDSNEDKLNVAKKLEKLDDNNVYSDYDKFLSDKVEIDWLFICTQDKDHFVHTIKGIEQGYNILLEKPISGDIKECLELARFAKEKNVKVAVCHVLRYTYFYGKVKEIIDSGVLGRIVSIEMQENVGYWHQAHSYVRGDWRRSESSTPMIFSKCCHDLDIAVFLANSMCKQVSSVGKLNHFRPDDAPEITADKCVNCKNNDCPYDARKLYIDKFKKLPKIAQKNAWPMSRLVSDACPTLDKLQTAIRNGQFGNCVYRNDNNVVDYQVSQILFDNEINCTLTMTAFSYDPYRTIMVRGTRGQLEGKFEDRKLIVHIFGKGKKVIKTRLIIGGHGGGDLGLISSIINGDYKTDIDKSIESHVMAYAIEESRLQNGKMINIAEYKKKIELN